MATTTKQLKYETIATLESTSLNSLGANASLLGSAVGSDSGDANLYADFELVATWGTAPANDSEVKLYLIRSADGSNYEDGSGSVRPPSGAAVGGFQVRNVTSAQRMIIRDVLIPPGLWKPLLTNTNQAMAASGNTLKIRYHNLQNV